MTESFQRTPEDVVTDIPRNVRPADGTALATLLLAFSGCCLLGYSWAAVARLDLPYHPSLLAAAVAVIICLVALAVVDPLGSVCLVLACLPLFGNHPGGRLMEVLNIPLAASAAGLVLRARRERRPPPRGTLWLAAGLYVLSAAIAIIPTVPGMMVRWRQINDLPIIVVDTLTAPESDPLYSLGSLVLLALAVAWAAALAWANPDRRFFRRAFWSVTIALFIVVAIGILDFHRVITLESAWLLRIDDRTHDTTGFQSIFWNPGWFAWYFVMAFGIAIGLARMQPARRQWLLAGALVVCYGYFFTNPQRGGLIALHGSLALLGIYMLASRPSRRIGAAIPVLAAVLLALIVAFYLELLPPTWAPSIARLIESPAEVSRSNLVRASLWNVAIEMWRGGPLFGLGEGVFAWRFSEYVPPGSALDLGISGDAHSTWFQILSTRGLFGLAAYFFLFLAVVMRLEESLKSSDAERRGVALGLTAALLAFFLYSFVQAMFYLQSIQVFFWAIVALVSLLPAPNRRPMKMPGVRRRLAIPVLVIAVLLAQTAVTRSAFVRVADVIEREPAGFFAPQIGGPDGAVVRWSSRSGTLCLYPSGPIVTVRMFIPDPRIDILPRTVTLTDAGRLLQRLEIRTLEVVSRSLTVPGKVTRGPAPDVPFGTCLPGQDPFRLGVEVSRTWSPFAAGYGPDTRTLGVAMLQPRYSDSEPGTTGTR